MYCRRSCDDDHGTHYRTQRVNCVDGEYFFATRESRWHGPFFTREDAEHQLALYVHRMQRAEQGAHFGQQLAAQAALSNKP